AGASEPMQAIPIELRASATTEATAAPATATTTEESSEPAATTAAPAEPTIFEIQQEGSEVSYIIDEVLRGSPTTVIGTSNQVAGQIAVNPADPGSTQVGVIQINARTFATDQDRRDNAVRNFILNTDQFEFITFTPTSLVGLPESAAVGESYAFQIVGDLTIRDTTREVTWDVTVTPVGEGRLEGSATTSINRADWGLTIPNVPFVANVSEAIQLEIDFVATAL
ncbi:MAG: YceI family protein, partial [Ardenticatenales bacterium]|nr:YceI family protein [Ardenticatenales bacterium]